MEISRTDVLIAGAGMAGATAALACAHAGLRVVLVDPLPFETQVEPTFDGRASAIAWSSFRQWKVLGMAEALEPHACRIDHILVTDGRTPGAATGKPSPMFLKFDAAEISDRSDGEPMGWMMENRHTRAALSIAVEAQPAITVLAPASVANVEAGPGGATVTLADGRVIKAAVVVAADGKFSAIRERAGITTSGWDYGQCGVVATVKMEQDHGNVAHEYFLPGGPFAILPLTGSRASLVWTEPKDRAGALRTASDEAFHAHLHRRFGDFLGRVEVVGPRFVYPLSLSLADQMWAPRIVLLGDSAHAIHPIAGQGLNLGLKDAAALAEVLADAARLGEDIGSDAVLERYAAWRRFDNVTVATATDAFVHLFSNDNPIVRAARDVGMAVVNRIGPARRFFMTEAGGAVGDLPKLLRGEAI
jgi:2-octaprenyl-6-methoxyphenol hydroxylase